jgi:DNA-3-methyladenine glycosylase I
VKLFRRTFVFTGDEIVGEFLISLGWLPGAHADDCPVAALAAAAGPAWLRRPGALPVARRRAPDLDPAKGREAL